MRSRSVAACCSRSSVPRPRPIRASATRWLSFAIVGGGPTGVELAGTLAEIARHTLRREFRHIDPATARVRLIEAGPRVLSTFPESLSAAARRQLEKLGVEVVTGTPVSEITAEGYRLGDAFVPRSTVLWAAGVAASPLARSLGVPAAIAPAACRCSPISACRGIRTIFVAGDLAQSCSRTASRCPASRRRRSRWAARRARDPGAPARRAGAARSAIATTATWRRSAAWRRSSTCAGCKFSGLLAWWFWLAAHVFFLIGFRNRLVVLINWAWAYWTYQRGARIVLDAGGADSSPPPDEQKNSTAAGGSPRPRT